LPEWLTEEGVGETRTVLVDGGEIIEAHIELDDVLPAGRTLEARLISVGSTGRNAIAVTADGTEFLLPRAPQATEGSTIRLTVTRARIPGSEPWKRPLARLAADEEAAVTERPSATVLAFPPLPGRDRLAEEGWDELLEQARSGVVRFDSGELRISPTPAMTLIDVDGQLPPTELAARGAREAAKAIRRLDIGGSIGIDLPTVGEKAARQLAGQAIDDILPKPFERTAMNGFGFLQIVRPRRRASLIELAQDRAAFEARALLRRAASAKGAIRLAVHPAVAAALRQDWAEALSRQVGGMVTLRADPTLTMSGGYAEAS